jgi:hypothetical protein
MRTLPAMMLHLLNPFVPLFSRRLWPHVQVLLAGAILAPGKRTVSAALRVMGLGQTEHFQRYHRVLNRAAWSGRETSHVLLGVLVKTFMPSGPLVIGVDETLERRWGKKIAAKGVYRDPVRSTHERFVKSSGLRWVCLMLLVPVPWAGRVWALPFLSVLAPSERYAKERGKHHKKITDWARQMLLLVRRWWSPYFMGVSGALSSPSVFLSLARALRRSVLACRSSLSGHRSSARSLLGCLLPSAAR